MELLAQGDSVFDLLDERTHHDVRQKLLLAQEAPGSGKDGPGWHPAAILLWPLRAAPDPPRALCLPAEVTFVGEMRTSKALRLQHGGDRPVAVRGRFVVPAAASAAAFLALCTPLARLPADGAAAARDELFQSSHLLDMTFADVTER